MNKFKFLIVALVAVILLPSISFGSIYFYKKSSNPPVIEVKEEKRETKEELKPEVKGATTEETDFTLPKAESSQNTKPTQTTSQPVQQYQPTTQPIIQPSQTTQSNEQSRKICTEGVNGKLKAAEDQNARNIEQENTRFEAEKRQINEYYNSMGMYYSSVREEAIQQAESDHNYNLNRISNEYLEYLNDLKIELSKC